MSFATFTEDHEVVHREIQYAREAHSHKIAYDHIPAEELFNQQKQPQTKEEYCRAGKVITDETSEEIVSADILSGPVTPHIKIEYKIVGDDRTLK